MSTVGGNSPVPVTPWNLDVEPGDPAELFGHQYFFERVDPDGAVTFRPPAGSDTGDFMIVGEHGRARKPTCDEVGALMITNECIWREKPLRCEVRRFARAQELDAAQARAVDPVCQFRMAIIRRFLANPWSRSDYGLNAFMQDALSDPKIAALPGAWPASPPTVRTWLNTRGAGDSRKERDGISMKNKMPRLRKLKHPIEIAFYHAVRATNVRGSVQMNHDSYVAEIANINAGQRLNRNFWIDPEGEAGPCERPAEYPVPNFPYSAMPYQGFWKLCRWIKSAAGYGRKTTPQAVYHRYGGGGSSDLPSHLGARSWIDSTPVPKAFFVDDDSGIPIGSATLTLLTEHRSNVVYGWDLCAGDCNSSALLRTVLCGNKPKEVQEDLLKDCPDLAWLRLRPDVIGFDNATENHGRTVEDNLADAYIGCDFTGAHMPRDKSAKERIMRTFLDLLVNHMPDANYDIARMRPYGFDPSKGHVLCSLRTGRRLLARAVMTYNITRSRGRGRDGRQPALVWKQSLGERKLNVIKDVDKFERGIGTVKFLTMNNSGIEMFGRRYTPGAVHMKRILQDFERAQRSSTAKTHANRDDRKRFSFEVKIRFDEDDLGSVQVWNPHSHPACWEYFECADPSANELPKWLDERCRELAAAEALEYLSPQGQALVRSRLFEDIANTDSKAAERQRQTLAKAIDDPRIRQVMSTYVEVTNEVVELFGVPQPEEHTPAQHELAVGARKDAHLKTPRSKPPPEAEPVKMQRIGGGRTRSARDPATPAPRRGARSENRNSSRRNAPAPNKSATRPDQHAPTRARSTRLKWGDVM